MLYYYVHIHCCRTVVPKLLEGVITFEDLQTSSRPLKIDVTEINVYGKITKVQELTSTLEFFLHPIV